MFLVIGGAGRDSARIDIQHGGNDWRKAQRIYLPLPLTPLAWALKVAGPWLSEMDSGVVDELMNGLAQADKEGMPLEVIIDDEKGGKHIRLQMG
jgi:hypothetical protein